MSSQVCKTHLHHFCAMRLCQISCRLASASAWECKPAIFAVQDNASLPASAPLPLVDSSVAAGLCGLRRLVSCGSQQSPLFLHAPLHVVLVLAIPSLRVLGSCMLHKVFKIGMVSCSLSLWICGWVMPLALVLHVILSQRGCLAQRLCVKPERRNDLNLSSKVKNTEAWNVVNLHCFALASMRMSSFPILKGQICSHILGRKV